MAVPVTGYTELDLVGFTDKGTYNAATTYVANDLVSYNGIKWKCLQDGTVGVTPAEGVSWSVFIVDNEIKDNETSLTSTWSSQKINNTKADQTAIAPVENLTTASRAYAIGENFMKDGAFCTAIAAIAQGATFTLNTNYTAGTVGERVAEIEGDVSDIQSDITSENITAQGTNVAHIEQRILIKNNNTYSLNLKLSSGINGLTKVYTLPSEAKPHLDRLSLATSPLSSADNGKILCAFIDNSNGDVWANTSSATSSSIFISGTWVKIDV